jgi:hypothetical protein
LDGAMLPPTLVSPSRSANHDTDADRDRQRQQWTRLGLVGDAFEGVTANLATHPDCPAAEIGSAFGRSALTPQEAIGNIVDHGTDRVSNQIAGRESIRRRAAPGLSPDRGQFPFNGLQLIDDRGNTGVGKGARTRLKHPIFSNGRME